MLQSIAESWEGKSDWEVNWLDRGEENGVYQLELFRPADGMRFSVMNLQSNSILNIAGFTTCFTLDEPFDPNRKY